jgi:general secretion pathway protein E
MTMEDPVEYHIEGVMQSQIDEKIGFTFERGLRSLVRQDPDVAMVGEVRDGVTAQIAIEAALTGHVVLSSLHTNDAVGAITRLLDMGIEPFLVTASVTAVLAQRLVRVLCESCKERRRLDDVQRALVDENGWNIEMVYVAKGCNACQNLGHKGRTGVFELFVVDDDVRHLVMQGASEHVIREHAVAHGMTLLRDDVIAKVTQGIISFDTLFRYCR